MKKISIIGLSLLLAACSSGTYTTDVSTETHQEEYQQQVVAQTMANETVMAESNVVEQSQPVFQEQVALVEAPQAVPPASMPVQSAQPERTQTKRVVKLTPDKKVNLLPPTAAQKQQVQRFGYTLQVVALDSSAKAITMAEKLPAGHPVWQHYKQVNGTDWYTLLYGDYASKSEARAAIATLPEYFRKLKPFVKSLDDIKNSDFPKLQKLK